MLHLFKPSACPLRFASGTHLFFQCNCFYFPQCRHGLAATSQTVSVGHERNEQPKGKPRTSWRLLRRLIGESRDPCRFVSYGTLAGCQYSNRACLANPINLLFVEPWVWIWKSFRARPKFHVLILLLPRNIPIRLFLSASRTYNLPVQAFIRSILYLFCSFSVLFRSSHLTNPHFLPAFQSIPPTRTGTVNPQNKSVYLYISRKLVHNWYTNITFS